MKLWFTILFCCLSCVKSAYAQTLLTILPAEDAVTTLQSPNQNWGEHNQLSAYAWTQGGQFCLHRSFIRFDLHPLGVMGPLIKATLKLHHYDPVGLLHSGQNAIRIAVADAAWQENTITWNNQPQASNTLFIHVPASVGTQTVSADVTSLVQHQFYNGNTGFVIQLLEEQLYRMLLFGSKEKDGFAPQLELEFVDQITRCDTFYSTNQMNMVELNSAQPFTTALNPMHARVGVNTTGGLSVHRLWIKPNLALLPPSINLVYASLKLTIDHPNGTANLGVNRLNLHPITSAANPNSLSWNNQPGFNSAAVASAVAPAQNYGATMFDVKPVIQHQLNSGQLHGFMIKQANEFSIGSSFFAGTGFGLPNVNPTLLICYTINTSTPSTQKNLGFSVFPNPASDWLFIYINQPTTDPLQLTLIDQNGQLIQEQRLNEALGTDIQMEWSIQHLSAGVYTLICSNKHQTRFQKVVILR
jgi:hypothetical protein